MACPCAHLPRIALAIMFALSALGGAPSAFAQRAPAGGPAQPLPLEKIFDTDLADLKPNDALKSLADKTRRERPECPEALTLKVVVKGKGDPLFEETLAKAREEALEVFFNTYGLRRNRDYKVEIDVKGAKDDVQVREAGGRKNPSLKTTSNPPNRSRVKPGDTIAVTIEASDDADATQSGIRAMNLLDMQKNGLHDVKYFPDSAKCTAAARRPEPFKAKAYTVPAKPPPLVRLESSTEDFAGTDVIRHVGIFPTGDWYGTKTEHYRAAIREYEHTITWTFAVSAVPSNLQVRGANGEIIFSEVRGRAVWRIAYSDRSKAGNPIGKCTITHQIAPAVFETDVTGQLYRDGSGGRLIVNLPDPGVTETYTAKCEGSPAPSLSGTGTVIHPAETFDISPAKDGARTVRESPGATGATTTTMELHQAKQ